MKTRHRLALVLGSALAVGLPTSSRAGSFTPGLERFVAGKPTSEKITALVVMNDAGTVRQMDVDFHAAKVSIDVRHKAIVDELRSVAMNSQTGIVQELEARKSTADGVEGFTPYWIVNGIVVRGTIEAIRELAARPDVNVVEADIQPMLIAPVRSATDEGLRGGGIGITPGVVNIGARRVWEELGIDGTGTIVANMDTGVDATHPALSSRWRGNFAPAAHCWHDAIGAGGFPVDSNSHGTHVMGTITGQAPNDTIGVAPGALWIADNSINQGVGPAFDSDVLAALQWFADPDGNSGTTDDVPDVVQNSWRISEAFGGDYVDCDSRWWVAIDNCEAAGVVTTWSAGNEGPGSTTIGSPADRATSPYNTFSVGSTIPTPPFTISSFSSRGPSGCGGAFAIKPEISAPGDNIYSAQPGGGYQFLSGTSMAGPHIAGVVALMRSANPDLDVQTIKQILLDTTVDLGAVGEDNTYGHGFVDAFEAVTAALSGYGKIEGIVTSVATGLPIANVAIDVLADPRQTTTDVNGFFRVTLPAGNWNLEFSAFGYTTTQVPFVVNPDLTTDGDTALNLAPQALVTGVVRDFNSAVVGGATVAAIGVPLTPVTTLPDGSYSLSVPSGSTYTIRARKNGFNAHAVTLPVSGPISQDFVLGALTIEDFESGDHSVWPWVMSGTAAWTTDTSTKFEGNYSSRSGIIGNNGTSTMELTVPIAAPGNMTFYVNVSSEGGSDLLRFYIDGVLRSTWSGTVPWTLQTHAVTPGAHNFRWTYSKNGVGSSGADAAWVDFVSFPAIGFPEISLSASSMNEELAPNETSQQQLTLSNAGPGQLIYNAVVQGVPAAQPGRVSVGEPEDPTKRAGGSGEGVILGSGGPDLSGYRWIDSDEPGGPAYNWVEINSVGTPLVFGDNTFSGMPIGFTFPFYGNNFTQVRVSANGLLTFTAPIGSYAVNGTIPSVTDPDDLIAVFWDDLNPSDGGAMYRYFDSANNRFIVEWDNVAIAGTGGASRVTCQVILYGDGSIVTQYKTVSIVNSCTVGIENNNGTVGLQVVSNAPYLHNNHAIWFGITPPPGWLSAAPLTGTVLPGGQNNITLTYDSTGLVDGVYDALLFITTNDPDESAISVPVTLTVSSATGVEVTTGLPSKFALEMARPNPFAAQTSIRFAVPTEGRQVSVSIFDVAGRRVRTLVDGAQTAGYHAVTWDGYEDGGQRATSGVYFVKMVAGEFTETQKVTVLK